LCRIINCRYYFHLYDAFLKTLRTLVALLRLSVCLSDYALAIFPSWLRTVKLLRFTVPTHALASRSSSSLMMILKDRNM